MADQAIIDRLIDTYRTLNMQLRGQQIPPAVEQPIAEILRRLRDRELHASQAIKQMLLNRDVVFDDDELPDDTDTQPATALALLAQFGTAREATLSVVRELPDEVWETTYPTPRGEMTLRAYLQTLIDRDAQRIAEIQALLPVEAARP